MKTARKTHITNYRISIKKQEGVANSYNISKTFSRARFLIPTRKHIVFFPGTCNSSNHCSPITISLLGYIPRNLMPAYFYFIFT